MFSIFDTSGFAIVVPGAGSKVAADQFATGTGTKLAEEHEVDRLAEETCRAVGHGHVRAARVIAADSGEIVRRVGPVDAGRGRVDAPDGCADRIRLHHLDEHVLDNAAVAGRQNLLLEQKRVGRAVGNVVDANGCRLYGENTDRRNVGIVAETNR